MSAARHSVRRYPVRRCPDRLGKPPMTTTKPLPQAGGTLSAATLSTAATLSAAPANPGSRR